MKIIDFLKNDILYVFIISLMIGLILGFCCPKEYSANFKILMQKVYVKFHPECQKNSKTIIIDKVSESTKNIPQTSIFEEPKKENKVLLFIKKVFVKDNKTENDVNINNFVID